MDAINRTNHHVFAVMGVNNRQEYGDICIILDPAVLQHVDAYLTPTAATGFVGRWTFRRRPWAIAQVHPGTAMDRLQHPGVRDEHDDVELLEPAQRITAHDGYHVFRHSQLHVVATPGWERALADDIAAQARMLLSGERPRYTVPSQVRGHDRYVKAFEAKAAEKVTDEDIIRYVALCAWCIA